MIRKRMTLMHMEMLKVIMINARREKKRKKKTEKKATIPLIQQLA